MRLGAWWNIARDWWSRLKGNERLSLIFEFVIVLATTSYAYISYRQWTALNGSIEVYREQSKTMAGQLEAMQVSNRINQEAIVSVQRAFISFVTIEQERAIVPSSTGGRIAGLIFKPVIVNGGTTPAIDVIGYRDFEALPVFPPHFRYSEPSKAYSLSLGPKATGELPPLPVPLETIIAVRDNKLQLRIWGTIRYRDVFPNTKLHVTKFCVEMSGQSLIEDITKPAAPFNFAQCLGPPSHNCTDEQCDKEDAAEEH